MCSDWSAFLEYLKALADMLNSTIIGTNRIAGRKKTASQL